MTKANYFSFIFEIVIFTCGNPLRLALNMKIISMYEMYINK